MKRFSFSRSREVNNVRNGGFTFSSWFLFKVLFRKGVEDIPLLGSTSRKVIVDEGERIVFQDNIVGSRVEDCGEIAFWITWFRMNETLGVVEVDGDVV